VKKENEHVKRSTILSILILVSMVLVALPAPMAAQGPDPAAPPKVPSAARPAVAPLAPQPEWDGTWQYGPQTGFQFTRFDGGYYPVDGMVYFMGGRLADSTTDGSVWSFDPVAGTYADMGVDLVEPISNYKMNLLQDETGAWGFYTFCGRPEGGGVIKSVQVYYPDTNTAVQLDPADDFPAEGCTSALNVVYDNKVYVAGGFDPLLTPPNWDYTYVFDPTAAMGSKWTLIPSATLSTARGYIMGAVVDDLIYAIGGAWYDGTNLINVTTVEVLDPNAATPVWDDGAAADLPEECSSSRAWGFDSDVPYVDPDGTPFAGKIVSACGLWPTENNHVFVYDTALDFWEAFPYLNDARRDEAGEFLPPMGGLRDNGMPGMWVWGGRQGSDANVLVTSEYYDVISGTQECNILLVDDDWDQYSGEPYNGTGTYYYTSTLESLNYTYDRWDVWTQGDPGLADMQGYDAVVWFTGYSWNGTVTSTNEIDLSAYLDGGGNLFLTAYDYLYDQGLTAFGSNYLGIDSFTSDTGEVDPVGNAGDPVGDGLGPFALVAPTSWPQGEDLLYDDQVNPVVGASAPFSYVSSGADNSTDLDSGSWKTVFTGWPFEGLDSLAEREVVLSSVLDWFGCPAPPPPDAALIPPFQADIGAPGATVPYTLTIINNLGGAEIFNITYEATWPTSGPATVGPVPNGGMEDFVVEVTVPADANCYEMDEATVTAAVAGVFTDTAAIETMALPADMGNLEGIITDANTGLPLENARIALELNNETYYYYTFSAADGYYLLEDIPACTYNGQFNAFGYYPEYPPVTITEQMTTTMDMALDASWPELSDDAISINVPPDSAASYPLTLDNLGTGDLHFHFTEVPNESIYPLPLSAPAMPAGVDPQVYADLAASPDGTAKFIVYMREQADLSAAFGIRDRSARGQYVLNALQSTAQRSQDGLRAELDRAGAPYESRYIANALVVEGDVGLVDGIAARSEVAYIAANGAIPAPEPVEIDPGIEDADAVVWNVTQVNADDVWSAFGTTGEGIVVSNIDTGVLYTHTALVDAYRGNEGGGTFDHNYNWWDPYGDQPLAPYDYHSHGSHTIGTMVGGTAATGEEIGMAPGGQWIACNGFEQGGPGWDAELLECAEFILAPWDLAGANPDPDMRPDVVNNSWGGGSTANWWYNQAIYAWRAAGIFPVFSNGNSGDNCGTAGYPGASPNVMAVGATDISDTIAGFSSRGPADITGALKPQVSAPGVGVISAYNNGNIGGMSGTSMAAPHVGGEAALIWSAVPELRGDVQLTYWIIEQSAMGITTDEGCGGDGPTDIPNNTYGWGRIDAFEAVSLALSSEWDISWLDVTPVDGVVAPMDSADITLDFDTTGLTLDECYTGTLKVEYNDPYVVEEFLPVELCVAEPVEPMFYVYLPVVVKDH
jgi:subtilisin family serine protease